MCPLLLLAVSAARAQPGLDGGVPDAAVGHARADSGARTRAADAGSAAVGVAARPLRSSIAQGVAAEPAASASAPRAADVAPPAQATPTRPAAEVAQGAAPGDTSPAAPELATPAPAAADSGLTFTPSLQARTRGELRTNPYGYAGGEPQNGRTTRTVLTRIRAGVEGEAEGVSIVASVQDVRRMGEVPPSAVDGSFTMIHHGYLQIEDGKIWARLGRQALTFGDQRLIGGADWSMSGRAFDALRLHVESDDVVVDAFGAMVRLQRTVTDAAGATAESDGDYLSGAHLTWHASEPLSLDVYLLYRSDGAEDADLLRDRSIVAPGVRVVGQASEQVKLTGELVYQGGTVRSSARPRHRQQALGLAGDVTFTPHATTSTSLGGAFATGDSQGSSWTELDNFYPTNRRHYGYANLMGWRNMREGYAKLGLKAEGLPLRGLLAYHVFAQANGEARWSNAGGATLGQSGVEGSVWLGSEVDLTARWEPLSPVFVELGYALFLPASGATRLGHPDPTQLFYLFVGGALP